MKDSIVEGQWNIGSNKIFNRNNRKIMISVDKGSIYEIDNLTEKIFKNERISFNELKNICKGVYEGKELEELIETMEKQDLIKNITNETLTNENKYNYENNNIYCVTLMVIQDCNLRCTYCYGDGGEYNRKGKMSRETAFKSIDYLVQNSGDNKKLNVTFFGGEPLLQFKLIKEVVEYAKEIGKENDKEMRFAMTTNGTLLTKEISDYLIKNKFSITLSIDGTKKNHNIHRVYSNDIGSYDNVIKNSKYLRENYKINARGTITPENMKLSENFNHLNEMKFYSVYFSPCFEMLKDEDYAPLLEKYNDLICNLKLLLKNKDYKAIYKNSTLISLLEKIHMAVNKIKACGALNNMIAIDIEGNIYPCHRFVSVEKFKLGNIFDEYNKSLEQNIMKDMLIDSSKDCTSCWAKNICGGGCVYENYVKNKSISSHSEVYCNYMKKLIENLIYFYVDLSEEERKILFERSKKGAENNAAS